MNRRTFVSSLASSAFFAAHGRPLYALAETEQQAVLREKLKRDPLRPQFHLLPRANWMNDPCAPRFFRGQYHMFFQYNPGAAVWGDMHWAHAVSPDLIHWKHMPVALSPTLGGYDAAGCFTGSVLPGVEVPTILYTGVTRCSPQLETIRGEGLREVQCLATSTDPDLRTWRKLDKPALDGPPPGLQVTGFRDPCPWKDGDTWYLGVGSGFNKIGGAVLLYTSRDGRNWS
jgi:beta-fructofuranosidase